MIGPTGVGSWTSPEDPPKPKMSLPKFPTATTPKTSALKVSTDLSATGTAGLGALLGAVAHHTMNEHPTLTGAARDAAIGAAVALALQHLMHAYALQDESANVPAFADTRSETLL